MLQTTESITSVISVVYYHRLRMKLRKAVKAFLILSRKDKLQFIKTILVMQMLYCKADYKMCQLPFCVNAHAKAKTPAITKTTAHVTDEAHELQELQMVQTSHPCFSSRKKRTKEFFIYIYVDSLFTEPALWKHQRCKVKGCKTASVRNNNVSFFALKVLFI